MLALRPRRAKDKGKELIPPPKRTRKDGGPVEQPDFETATVIAVAIVR